MSTLFLQVLGILQHLPEHLQAWATDYGAGLYAIVAAIIFAETGLVVTPFLPGDSLLFATGALLALHLPGLELAVMIPLLIGAALVGDTLNFTVGKWMAPRIFKNDRPGILNQKYLDKTRDFYTRHGGKTVILARFLPILRTYTPFVSGLSGMKFPAFFLFSLTGGSLWITTFVCMGYFFGNLPSVRTNFHFVIMAILAISVAPIAVEILRSRLRSRRA